MVIKDCFAFASDVSPQTPISFLSWIILQSPHQVLSTDHSIKKYSRRDKPVERKRINRGIGINHENVFVERWVHANYVFDLVINLEFQGIHRGVEVDLSLKIKPKSGGPNE